MIQIEDKKFEFSVIGNKAQFCEHSGHGAESYLVPTYGAIKGICESIYWRPTVMWIIDKIRVMNLITQTDKGELQNVEYQVQAHMEWDLDRKDMAKDRIVGKHVASAQRALKQGGRMTCYLGKKEPGFEADIAPCEFGKGSGAYDIIPNVSFGPMLHSVTYPSPDQQKKGNNKKICNYFDCSMVRGVITFPRPEQCPQHENHPYWEN